MFDTVINIFPHLISPTTKKHQHQYVFCHNRQLQFVQPFLIDDPFILLLFPRQDFQNICLDTFTDPTQDITKRNLDIMNLFVFSDSLFHLSKSKCWQYEHLVNNVFYSHSSLVERNTLLKSRNKEGLPSWARLLVTQHSIRDIKIYQNNTSKKKNLSMDPQHISVVQDFNRLKTVIQSLTMF